MQTVVTSTEILLLAEGDSLSAQNNARGHLFEEFIAQLVALFGYERPTRAKLNVTSNGIELDVTSRHKLTSQAMIAECKAYSSPIGAKELLAFYGKLQAERFDHRDLYGYFVAVPRLTKEGQEQQARCEANDRRFRVYTSDEILELLLDRQQISRFSDVASLHQDGEPLSDEALLVTPDGIFYAAHELAHETRLPTRVIVFPPRTLTTPVPPRVISLLKASASYTKGLPCVAAATGHNPRLEKESSVAEPVIEVSGSSSDFEYQFPAAPAFFVGRQIYVTAAANALESVAARTGRAQVIVLNAQSGWGKSSLALRVIAEARTVGGYGVCIDCRTATHPTFVAAALRHALLGAAGAGLVQLPDDASFATVSSALQTLRSTTFIARRPLCIFFDQFENVFQNIALTREFRDLALGVIDVAAPVVVGFSWKTDFVAFTESYPYQLRDDIRSGASVIALPPFGPTEIGELIARLQKSCGQKIHLYLRERMREYSQGLPWLFKKLASHIIREISAGTTQDELLSEVLNIQTLFESDVNCLNLREREALKSIARRAPLPVTEAVDLAGGERDVVQSLLNQRLLVSIGEKLDIYWDVFRDYLNQGTVPLQESYVLRLTPNSVRKLLITIRDAGGSTSPDEAARAMNSSVISVLNMARDLKQLGVLAAQEGVLRYSDDIAGASDLNTAVMARAANALKRHRVYSLLRSIAPTDGRVAMATFAEMLPKAYPAVEAKRHTWANYARAFAHWFHFAALAAIDRDEIVVGQSPTAPMDLLVPGKQRVGKGTAVFPRSAFAPVLQLLRDISAAKTIAATSRARKALADAKQLAFVEQLPDKTLTLTAAGRAIASSSDHETPALIRAALERETAYRVALPMVERNPGVSPAAIGYAVARELKGEWSEGTAASVGKYVRNWLRAAGVTTTVRERPEEATGDLFGS